MDKKKGLLETYLKYNNLVLCPAPNGNVNKDGMPFMPMLLMDAMNILYDKYIAPLDFKHRQKQIRTRWHEAYNHYINQEFMAFSDDQKCEICDIMDDFNYTIHNEVELFRVAAMGKFMEYDTDIRITLSAILACNALAQSAQIIYRAQRMKENSYIASIESWSHKLLNEYADNKIDRSGTYTDLNKFKDLDIASRNMCNTIIEFAKGLSL